MASKEGEHADSLAKVDSILAESPDDPEALFTRAYVLFEWGRYLESFNSSKRASAAGCAHAEHFRQLGWGYLFVGKTQEAESMMRRAIKEMPDAWQSRFALGAVLQTAGKWEDSLASLHEGLALLPKDRDALNLAGGAQLELKRYADAERTFRCAIEAEPLHPSSWTNLGVALSRQGNRPDAIAAFNRGYELDTDSQSNVDAFVNLAVNIREEGDIRQAMELYRRHIGEAQSVLGFFNYGLGCLSNRSLREGWHYYDFRWLCQPLLSLRPSYDRPAWDGQEISGKTIVIRGEQGFGDVIQFLRYAPSIKALGARVLLRLPAGFDDVARRMPGIDGVLAPDHQEDFDFYVHVMSLPRIFGTDETSIPAAIPYIAADPERVEKWRATIECQELKVGVVWAGSPDHIKDKQRSIDLDVFSSLFDSPGVRFYSLQMGPPADALETLAPRNVTILSANIQDFSDTAAILSLLDLVICVDTSVAHLAGAMGKLVWMLNAWPGDWRWCGESETTPWYPSMRIFRQHRAYGWPDVVERVRVALAELVKAAKPQEKYLPGLSSVQLVPLDPDLQSTGLNLLGHVAETRFGILQYVPDGAPASLAIRWYGEHLTSHLTLLAPAIGNGDTVVEVGAGVGLHAIAMATKVGAEGHVMLFESDARSRKILRQNLAANGVRNATVMRDPLGGVQQCIANCNLERTSGAENVERKPETLDPLRLEKLSLLKFNAIERLEEILAGAGETIWNHRPVIFASAVERSFFAATASAIQQFGYRCWKLETPLFDKDNFNARATNIFGDQHDISLLALPEELPISLDVTGMTEISSYLETVGS